MANREELNEEARKAGVENPEQYETKADVQAAIDKVNKPETTPAEQAEEDVNKSGVQGTDIEGSTVNDKGDDPSVPDAKSDGANDEDQTVADQPDGVDGVERDHTPAGTTAEANSQTKAQDRIQPPVAANGLNADASDEAYEANNQVNPQATATEVKEQENESNAEKEEARKDEAKVVETKLGSSEEEAAASRAGVQEENLENPTQNREPKNEFEASNQKVTEEERQAAQEVSDMTTEEKEDQAPTPSENAKTDAQRTAETNQGSAIAEAIRDGLKGQKEEKNIVISVDDSVTPRFQIGVGADGEPLIRETETGVISAVQMRSLEEKEADLQNAEFKEV